MVCDDDEMLIFDENKKVKDEIKGKQRANKEITRKKTLMIPIAYNSNNFFRWKK